MQTSPSLTQLSHSYGIDAQFFALWLDPYLAYSCGNWDSAGDLAAAQAAKLDAALDGLAVPPGARILDVGCGWGSLLRRGSERGYRMRGLVPVGAQAMYCEARGYDVVAQTWQTYGGEECYDALTSVGAFEHFAAHSASAEQRRAEYRRFFSWSAQRLQQGARMYLQTICFLMETDLDKVPKELALPLVRTLRPVRKEFPDSTLPASLAEIVDAADPHFEVVTVRSRRQDYARTCMAWHDRLRARRSEGVQLVGEEMVVRFEHYLTAAAEAFSQSFLTLYQLVFSKRVGYVAVRG
jgi:cyclopropane-fatty-acyl-phospholipid synthase